MKDAELLNLSKLFKMFADTNRLAILDAISKKECSVNEISELVNMSQSAVSHSLALLKRNGIIVSRSVANKRYYSLKDEHIVNIFELAKVHALNCGCE